MFAAKAAGTFPGSSELQQEKRGSFECGWNHGLIILSWLAYMWHTAA
jgi:hypothetical protein